MTEQQPTLSVEKQGSEHEKKCPGCGFRTATKYIINEWGDDDIPNCAGCFMDWLIGEDFEVRNTNRDSAKWLTVSKTVTDGNSEKCSGCRFRTSVMYSLPGWDAPFCGGCMADHLYLEDFELRQPE